MVNEAIKCNLSRKPNDNKFHVKKCFELLRYNQDFKLSATGYSLMQVTSMTFNGFYLK